MLNRVAIIAVAIVLTVLLRTVELQAVPGSRERVRDALVGEVVHPLARPFARTSVFESAITAAVWFVPDAAVAFAIYFALSPQTSRKR